MCGFVAILADDTLTAQARLQQATRLLAHRGPDDEAFYVSRKFSAGFRRLKIIDLSDDARQPMSDESKRFWIIFNGEIYNYLEVRKELLLKGFRFRTVSDTEVLLKAYLEWGEGCLERLNGMFAFLIWDEQQQTLFGARDRFGEKPLFYAKNGQSVIFASEIKSIISMLGQVPAADPKTIRRYVQHGELDATSNTFFADVKALPPAHCLTIQDDSLAIRPYWELTPEETPHEDPISHFRELFLDSIRLRVRSDVPVGTCLSGGVDSGAIVCSLSHVLKGSENQVTRKTFTASYPEFNEAAQVAAVNEHSGSTGYGVMPIPCQITDLIEIQRYHDEPVHSFTVYASYHVMKLAKSEGVTVLLNGQGADETLAGYSNLLGDYLQDLCRGGKLASALRAKKLARQFSEINLWEVLLQALSRDIRSLLWKSKQLQDRRDAHYDGDALSRCCMTYDFVSTTECGRRSIFHRAGGQQSQLKHHMLQSITKAHLPLYLRVEDRNSMAHSLESRLPFLDHRLAEFVFSLPVTILMKDGWNKYLLRESMKGILPEIVRQRRDKMGFPTPEAEWIYGDLRDSILELLTSRNFKDRHIFDAPRLESRFNRESTAWRNGAKGASKDRSFWFRLLSLETWFCSLGGYSTTLDSCQPTNQLSARLVNYF